VIVEGRSYLVPRKKYKIAKKGFANAEDTWAHIMENIDDYGRLLEEDTPEEEVVEEKKKPKTRRKAQEKTEKESGTPKRKRRTKKKAEGD
jgi:outer membrane biosynthesis protein TonB